jgi:hypothetical protein
MQLGVLNSPFFLPSGRYEHGVGPAIPGLGESRRRATGRVTARIRAGSPGPLRPASARRALVGTAIGHARDCRRGPTRGVLAKPC